MSELCLDCRRTWQDRDRPDVARAARWRGGGRGGAWRGGARAPLVVAVRLIGW